MNLDANTSLALMQATQSDVAKKTTQTKTLPDKDMKYIEEAAKDFEAMFLGEMIKPMFEGLETDSRFGGGKGEEIFRGFMIQEYGKIMAERGGIGIAEQVKAEMIRMQEGQNNPRAAMGLEQ